MISFFMVDEAQRKRVASKKYFQKKIPPMLLKAPAGLRVYLLVLG
jgi:hypothetical protein